MPKTDDYKVELEVFEGPLDLLLYLIKREEVDIYDIPIERITKQYMEYMNVMKMLDLNIAGEFIVMAATLMMIKSRMLLPVEDREEVEEEEEDPRWDLVRQLVEYKKFKDIASQLQERALLQENIFEFGGKNAVELEPDDAGLVMQDVSLFDLITAFQEVLKNAPPETLGEIAADPYTVADKIDYVLKTIRKKGSIRFTEMFGKKASRNEIICTFLAMLELLRLHHIKAVQDEHFAEIMITRSEEDDQEREDDIPSNEQEIAEKTLFSDFEN